MVRWVWDHLGCHGGMGTGSSQGGTGSSGMSHFHRHRAVMECHGGMGTGSSRGVMLVQYEVIMRWPGGWAWRHHGTPIVVGVGSS